jgi:pyruvate kinase
MNGGSMGWRSFREGSRGHGKYVVTATQILQVIISNSLPTCVEASDIDKVLLDGTDAEMLSGEMA